MYFAVRDALIAFQQTFVYDVLLAFFAGYPLVTSIIWVTTTLFFVFRWEKEDPTRVPIDRSFAPPVSVLIPAYNEEAEIAATLEAVVAIDYPGLDIIVINDGSKDRTVERVMPFVRAGTVRLIDKQVNEGKALALNDAMPMARGDILLIIDADAQPEPDIIWRMLPHFRGGRVAAVTGNPRVRNVDNFLTRLQAIEFTSIISMLRRSQRIWGRIVTVSGVVAAFRKNALFMVDGFSPEMLTEDIEVTWKLQRRFFDVRYEPMAIVWMTVPSTVTALFRQRLRWARGLMQVLRKHRGVVADWRCRRMWPMMTEAALSTLWAFCFVSMTGLWIVSYALDYPPVGASPIPNLWGMVIGSFCLIQLAVGTWIDHKYDPEIWLYFPYAVFYPLIYWAFLAFATLLSLPHLFRVPLRRPVTWNTRRDTPQGRS